MSESINTSWILKLFLHKASQFRESDLLTKINRHELGPIPFRAIQPLLVRFSSFASRSSQTCQLVHGRCRPLRVVRPDELMRIETRRGQTLPRSAYHRV